MQSIAQRYNALKLRVLDKVNITDQQWNLFEVGKQDPSNEKFRYNLPFVVAQWRQAAVAEVMRWVRQRDDLCVNADDLHRNVPGLADYTKDITDLHDALHPSCALIQEIMNAGKFTRPIAPNLHIHVGQDTLFYLCRLGSSPAFYIDWKKVFSLSAKEKQRMERWIMTAKESDNEHPQYSLLMALKEKGIIRQLPLGAVGIFLNSGDEYEGTLHGSDWFPAGTVRDSVFLNNTGRMRPAALQN